MLLTDLLVMCLSQQITKLPLQTISDGSRVVLHPSG